MKAITKLHKSALLILLLYGNLIPAQEVSFTQLKPQTPYNLKADFISVSTGKSQFIDIDFDGDQDVYISDLSQLYINDGNGNFEIANSTGIEKLGYSSNAFADFNNDGFLDLFQSGINTKNKRVTQLYRADSLYHFSLDTTNSFLGLALTRTDFADIDGDNDIDLIIAGQDSNSIGRTRLYVNHGNMIFSLSNSNLPDVFAPTVKFVDIDNDFDDDLIITGNNKGTRITKVYKNDSLGNFTEDLNQNLDQVYAGVTHFFDADNDGDLDLILTGDNSARERIAKLYFNNGQGVFTIKNASSFSGSFDGSIGSAYIDNDSLLDVIITGFNATEAREETNIYLNNGNGSFSKDLKNDLRGIARGSSNFADINADGFQDLLITGDTRYGTGISAIFLNDSNGVLMELTGTEIRELSNAVIESLDYNADSAKDLFISGIDKNNNRISEFYKNDQSGNLKLDSTIKFQNLICHAALAKDFNGDNYDDLLISGSIDNINSFVTLYLNNQNGDFTPSAISFDSLRLNHMLYFDVDNNGFKDIVVNGVDKTNKSRNYVYYSTANGSFSSKSNLGIQPFYNGDIDFADVDKDNDFDIIITGVDSTLYKLITTLYINDGAGFFSKRTNAPFKPLRNSTVNFIDIDNDGDEDCFLTGKDRSYNSSSTLYVNNNGIFSEFNSFNFEKIHYGTADFFDIDGDDLLDLFITGIDTNGKRISKFYIQFNKLDFRESTNNDIEGFSLAESKIINLNNDSLLDILITGSNDKNRSTTKAFLNSTCQVKFKVDSVTACDTLFWINNKSYTTDISDERFRIENKFGCDTVSRLFLQIRNSIISSDKDTACNQLIWHGKTLTQSGIYLDTIINSQYCNISKLDLQVNYIKDSIYRKNDTLIGSIDTNATIQWVNCSQNYLPVLGADTTSFILPDNDFYGFITDNGTCIDTSFCVSLTGLSNPYKIQKKFKLFPIPANDKLNIKLLNFQKPVFAKIYTIHGAQVGEFYISNSDNQINIESYSSGIYIIEVNNDRQIIVIE